MYKRLDGYDMVLLFKSIVNKYNTIHAIKHISHVEIILITQFIKKKKKKKNCSKKKINNGHDLIH